MTLMRRYLLILAIMFWQGGFTFYSAIVIHVGHDVLGSQIQQGYITRSVAFYLNMAGAVALLLWGWDIASSTQPAGRRRLRSALWIVVLLTLGLLMWLYVQLDELLDVNSFRILDRARFYDLHRWYLHLSTVQWVASLILTLATLLAWRGEDWQHGKVAASSYND